MRRHRRPLAALCAAVAVGCAVTSLAPTRPPVETVVVAARDLPAGHVLDDVDLTTVDLPPGLLPHLDAAGLAERRLAAPVRRGEPFTDVRLAGGELASSAGPGRVVAPVSLADPDLARVLQAGDRVDLLAARAAELELGVEPGTQSARSVARAATVLRVPAEPGEALLVAVTPAQALQLAAAAAGSRLSYVLLP